jgi:hypothetical protein
MLNPPIKPAQRGVIAAFLCLALEMAVLDGLSSQNPAAQPHSSAKTDSTTNQQKQEEAWWKRASEPLTVITFLLVVVGAAQLGLFYRQLTLIHDSLIDAKKAAEAAQSAAAATTKQAKISEDALVKVERPYVFVFAVRGIRHDTENGGFYVEYTVANYGKLPAIIEDANIGFEISDRAEPAIPPRLFDGHQLLASPILQSGEQRRLIRGYFPQGMLGSGLIVQIERTVRNGDPIVAEPRASDEVVPEFNIPEGFDLFFRAVIGYRGPFTHGHDTGALWLYNPGTFEFAVRGGEEYNYIK